MPGFRGCAKASQPPSPRARLPPRHGPRADIAAPRGPQARPWGRTTPRAASGVTGSATASSMCTISSAAPREPSAPAHAPAADGGGASAGLGCGENLFESAKCITPHSLTTQHSKHSKRRPSSPARLRTQQKRDHTPRERDRRAATHTTPPLVTHRRHPAPSRQHTPRRRHTPLQKQRQNAPP